MAVKKRCNFCLKPLRPDGTCANPECPRYVPLIVDENGYIGESIEDEKKDGQKNEN